MQYGLLNHPFSATIRTLALDEVVVLRGIEREDSTAGCTSEFNALYVRWPEDYFVLQSSGSPS